LERGIYDQGFVAPPRSLFFFKVLGGVLRCNISFQGRQRAPAIIPCCCAFALFSRDDDSDLLYHRGLTEITGAATTSSSRIRSMGKVNARDIVLLRSWWYLQCLSWLCHSAFAMEGNDIATKLHADLG